MNIEIRDEGTVVSFTPLDAEAKAWLEENTEDEGWWLGGSLVVDHHMAQSLVIAIELS